MGRLKGGKNKFSKKLKMICQNCGKEFEFYPYRKGEVKYCSLRCRPQDFRRNSTKGSKNCKWKGGKYKCPQGYIMVLVPNHPHLNHPDGYVFEHRFVMENHIGRYLTSAEQIHHINGIKTDNRIENLMLFESNKLHKKFEASQPNFHLHKHKFKKGCIPWNKKE